jgi:hypothetical protein
VQPLQSDDAITLVKCRAEPCGGPDVIAGREQMTGVQAKPEPRSTAGGLQQRRQLLERATERAPGAGCVLEVKRAAVSLLKRFCDHLAGSPDRLPDIAALRRARVQHYSAGADPVPDAQRLDERRE